MVFGTHPWSGSASDLVHERLLLVGTQTAEPSTSKGIYAYRFNAETGELTQIGLAVEAEGGLLFLELFRAGYEEAQGAVCGLANSDAWCDFDFVWMASIVCDL